MTRPRITVPGTSLNSTPSTGWPSWFSIPDLLTAAHRSSTTAIIDDISGLSLNRKVPSALVRAFVPLVKNEPLVKGRPAIVSRIPCAGRPSIPITHPKSALFDEGPAGPRSA